LRLLTLTVNPHYYDTPAQRLVMLAWAWRTTVKRLRREYGHDAIEYMAIVEATKLGEPHLHILLRSPFIPQRYLSRCMSELIHSPIVDIRKVRNADEVVRYVAKYVTKKPAQFGTSKRYWQSKNYQPPEPPTDSAAPADTVKWAVWRDGLHALLVKWMEDGYSARRDKQDSWLGTPITNMQKLEDILHGLDP